jgi:hypothetical protein
MARKVLEEGKAATLLQEWIQVSQEVAAAATPAT